MGDGRNTDGRRAQAGVKVRQPIVRPPGTPRGRVVVIESRCKGCGFCIEFCPNDVLVSSTRYNAKGYHFPEVASPERCVNCQLCYYLCPEFAIFAIEVRQRPAPPATRGAAASSSPDNRSPDRPAAPSGS